ncbi:hypothetical protein BC833DRAFT_574001 [Globomyces pollinis-pini]|nr:hypothetical protein BC833DRAFT_574001 [Globomyces pollinis-pini]
MASIFEDDKIIERIILVSNESVSLSLLNKRWHRIARLPSVYFKWFVRRPHLIEQWIDEFNTFQSQESIYQSFASWFASHLYPTIFSPRIAHGLLTTPFLIAILEYSFLSHPEWTSALWNAGCYFGNIDVGLHALTHLEFYKTLEQYPELLTNGINMTLALKEPADVSRGVEFLKVLTKLQPMQKAIEEAIVYASYMHQTKLLEVLINLPVRKNNLLSCLLNADNRGWGEIVTLLQNDQNQNTWKKFKKLISNYERDTLDVASNKLADYYQECEQTKNLGDFVCLWENLLERFIQMKDINKIKSLKRYLSRKNLDLYIGLHMFALALDSGSDEICDLLVDHINIKSTEQKEKSHCELILDDYCAISKRILFKKLLPLSNMEKTKQELLDFVHRHQVNAISYLVRTLRIRVTGFAITSTLLWSAFKNGNPHVADTLHSLGGNVGWMEMLNLKHGKPSISVEALKDESVDVEESLIGMFQAYGGIALTRTAGHELVVGKNADEIFELTRTRSTDKRSSVLTGRKVAHVTDDSHRLTITARDGPPTGQNIPRTNFRRQSFKGSEVSNKLWESHFSGEVMLMKKLLGEDLKVEWMDSAVDGSYQVPKQDRNELSQEPSIIRALAGLY